MVPENTDNVVPENAYDTGNQPPHEINKVTA